MPRELTMKLILYFLVLLSLLNLSVKPLDAQPYKFIYEKSVLNNNSNFGYSLPIFLW